MIKQNKLLWGWIITILLIANFICPILNFAQQQIDFLSLGKTIEFNSNVLNEKRDILIYTPAGYEESNIRFPSWRSSSIDSL